MNIRNKNAYLAFFIAFAIVIQLIYVPGSKAYGATAIANGDYQVPITYFTENSTTTTSQINTYLVPNTAVLTVTDGQYRLKHQFTQRDAFQYIGILKPNGTKASLSSSPTSNELAQYEAITMNNVAANNFNIDTTIDNPFVPQTILVHIKIDALGYNHWYHVSLNIDMSQFEQTPVEPETPEEPDTVKTEALAAIIDEATTTLNNLIFTGETALANPALYGTTDENILKYIVEDNEILSLPAVGTNVKSIFQKMLTDATTTLENSDSTQEEIDLKTDLVKNELAKLLSRKATVSSLPISILTSRQSDAETSPYVVYFDSEATLYDGTLTQVVRIKIHNYSEFTSLGTSLKWYNPSYNPLINDGTNITGAQTIRQVSYDPESDIFVGQLNFKSADTFETTGLLRATFVLPDLSTATLFLNFNVQLQQQLEELFAEASATLQLAQAGDGAEQYPISTYNELQAALDETEAIVAQSANTHLALKEAISKLEQAFVTFKNSQYPALLEEGIYSAPFTILNSEYAPSNALIPYIVSPAIVHSNGEKNRIYFTLNSQHIIKEFSLDNFPLKQWLVDEEKQIRIMYADIPYMPSELNAHIIADYAEGGFYMEEDLILSLSETMTPTSSSIALPQQFESLKNKISEVSEFLNNATEGTTNGKYPIGSKQILQKQVDTASQFLQPFVIEIIDIEQYAKQAETAIEQYKQLDTALQKFKSSVIRITPTTPSSPDESTPVTPAPAPTPAPTEQPDDKENNGVENENNQHSTFTDITNHWAKSYIEHLSTNKLITGYSDGSFRPNQNTTRAEIAVILYRLLNLEGQVTTSSSFTDQNEIPSWASNAINVLAELGIMNGSNGQFNARAEITRAELATLVARIAKLSANANTTTYNDAQDIPLWAAPSIQAATDTGFFEGDSKGNFNAKQSATRAEIAKVIYLLSVHLKN